jgi:hypothetical protein
MKMKKMVLLVLAAALAAVANAQCFERGALGYLLAGPCAERMFRQAYAPVDFALSQTGMYAGYGYPYANSRRAAIAAGAVTGMAAGAGIGAAVGRDTRSALIGAGAGAVAGGLITHLATRPSQPAAWRQATAADYQQQQVVFAVPKPQKPLDCTKPRGKRGRNEAACAAAEEEQARREAEAQAEAERQKLAASPWRLYNRSGFVVEVFDGEKKLGRMRPNQSWRVLEPVSGFRAVILAPDFSGAITEHEARIRPSYDFQGWVITSPKEE